MFLEDGLVELVTNAENRRTKTIQVNEKAIALLSRYEEEVRSLLKSYF
jgi:hypothetical protein